MSGRGLDSWGEKMSESRFQLAGKRTLMALGHAIWIIALGAWLPAKSYAVVYGIDVYITGEFYVLDDDGGLVSMHTLELAPPLTDAGGGAGLAMGPDGLLYTILDGISTSDSTCDGSRGRVLAKIDPNTMPFTAELVSCLTDDYYSSLNFDSAGRLLIMGGRDCCVENEIFSYDFANDQLTQIDIVPGLFTEPAGPNRVWDDGPVTNNHVGNLWYSAWRESLDSGEPYLGYWVVRDPFGNFTRIDWANAEVPGGDDHIEPYGVTYQPQYDAFLVAGDDIAMRISPTGQATLTCETDCTPDYTRGLASRELAAYTFGSLGPSWNGGRNVFHVATPVPASPPLVLLIAGLLTVLLAGFRLSTPRR